MNSPLLLFPALPMRNLLTLIFCLVALPGMQLFAADPARPAFGINISGPADWNTELPFIDVFRFSRPWISQRVGASWGKGPQLEIDQFGWVKRLEPNCFAETLMCTIEGGHYPSGRWNLYWTGDGKLEVPGGKVIRDEPGHLEIELVAKHGIFLRLVETNTKNPVRDIKMLMPGFTLKQEADNPWRPEFLAMWRNVACLRFMDLQHTNNSKVHSWAERSTLQHATYSERGVPVELLCDSANRLKCDAWFCMPHAADNDYCEQFAQLVHQKLNAPLKAYVEYSNEVWNGQFSQHQHAADEGKKLKFADKPWEAAWFYYAHRSVEIFKLWQKHLPAERLVRVLASQAANSYVGQQIVEFEKAGEQADVLAIAPYISFNVAPGDKQLNASQVADWSLDQVFEHIQTKSLPDAVAWMNNHKKLADQHRLRLVCYEAGQHLVGVNGAENNERLTKLLTQANRDQRMSQVITDYFAAWEKSGGDLLCYFSSVSAWSKHGSWGLLEYSDSPPENSPKYQAVSAWRTRLLSGKDR